jgi:hypothetical protein
MEEDNIDEGLAEGQIEDTSSEASLVSDSEYASLSDMPEEPLYREGQEPVAEEDSEGDEDYQEEVQEEAEEEDYQEEEVQEEEESDEVYFEDVLSENGLELEEGATINDLISHYKELLDESNNNEDLPKDLQLAIDSYRNGGDYNKVLQTLSLDFENMEGKDLLKHKFMQDNQELASKNQELANKKFEREFAAKYGILNNEFEDDFAKDEFMEENGEDYGYAKMQFEQEINDTKEFLNNWKSENTSEDKIRNEMSEEQREEIINNYYSEVDYTLDDFGGLSLSIDDNEENDYVLGADEESLEAVRETMKDPINFFKEAIGYDVTTGEIDTQTFATVVHLLQNINSIGPKLGQYYLEQSDKETVESMLENATQPNQPNQVRQPMEEDVISAAKAIRQRLYGNR